MIITRLPRWGAARPIPAPKRGPAARLALPAADTGRGLRFTEWLLMGTLALTWMLACSTPLFGVKLYYTFLNHSALVLFGPVLVLSLAAAHLQRRPPPWQRILGLFAPLLALALFAAVGSAIARWELGVRDTYLTFGVYLATLPLFAAAVPTPPHRAREWARAATGVAVAFGVLSLLGQLARPFGSEALHEIEYVVVSAFLLLYYAVGSKAVKLLALVAMAAAALYNHKLTGYIILSAALLHVGVNAGWRRLDAGWRRAYSAAALVIVIAVVLALTLLYFEFREYLPSGNTDVRIRQYEAAWRQFLASPVWGNAFLDGSGEDFAQSLRVLNIPTHSDLLDMLKHGGLIAFGLFVWGYARLFRLIHVACRHCGADRLLYAYFVGTRFFQVTALATFAINPLLLKGPYLLLIWGSLGLAAGVAMTVVPPRGRPARRPTG